MALSTGVLLALLPITIVNALTSGRPTAWAVVVLLIAAIVWRLVLDRRRATR